MKQTRNLREIRGQLDRVLAKLLDRSIFNAAEKPAPAPAPESAPVVIAKAEAEEFTYVLMRIPDTGQRKLTPREREIARLAGEGLQNKEIADRLGIGRATVATHLRRIFTKLEVNTRTELAQQSMLLA